MGDASGSLPVFGPVLSSCAALLVAVCVFSCFFKRKRLEAKKGSIRCFLFVFRCARVHICVAYNLPF